MGKTASINDVDMTVIREKHWQAECSVAGPAGLRWWVFSSGYRPRRGDRVVMNGQHWTVTRHERF